MLQRSATASLIRSATLDLIRERSPVSCSEIVRQLKMSMPTMMRWLGDSRSTGGRSGNRLNFNAAGDAVLGLRLGGEIENEIYRLE